jgi:hypothetical protein
VQDYIVCGWYTPDYKIWATRLFRNLKAHGLAFDFVEVEPLRGSWEKKTRAKAEQVLNAMDRHPGKTIFFLDVDCEVVDPGRLLVLKDMSADVGFYLHTRFRKSGGIKWEVRSGTLVIQPTREARNFVETWRDKSYDAPAYCNDQDTLMVAMGKCPDCAFRLLDVRYCAIVFDNIEDPYVFHSSASVNTPKATKWKKRFARWFGVVLPVKDLAGA